MFISDQINELRAELAGCVFSKAERAKVEAELAALILERLAVEQSDVDAASKLLRGDGEGR